MDTAVENTSVESLFTMMRANSTADMILELYDNGEQQSILVKVTGQTRAFDANMHANKVGRVTQHLKRLNIEHIETPIGRSTNTSVFVIDPQQEALREKLIPGYIAKQQEMVDTVSNDLNLLRKIAEETMAIAGEEGKPLAEKALAAIEEQVAELRQKHGLDMSAEQASASNGPAGTVIDADSGAAELSPLMSHETSIAV